MIDLYFGPPDRKKIFDCSQCRKNPVTAKQRNCEAPGFDNLRRPMKVNPQKADLALPFCPAKATWYPEIAELFNECRVTLETGILPKEGAFLNQSDLFHEVFPYFVERWKEKTYQRMWDDIQDFTLTVVKGIFGGKKGGRGGG